MRLPHLERPICEPVELLPGAPVRAERIVQGNEASASEPFVHYHDVYELVLFGQVGGWFSAGDRRYELQPHSVAYIPSMCEHDFALEPGPRDWILIQIDAAAGAALTRAPGLERLHLAFCTHPDPALQQRLQALGVWLTELNAADSLTLPLIELLLRSTARAEPVKGEIMRGDRAGLHRLRPAIDRLREDPAHAPGAEQAAELCALSQAYFSRRFKQQVGLSWSDYVRIHRLHLASRQLLESHQSISAIAYALGFATPSHFTELFQQRFGMSPRDYRRAGSGDSEPPWAYRRL